MASQIVGKAEDPLTKVMTAVQETPKAVDALIEEEPINEKLDEILESVGKIESFGIRIIRKNNSLKF